MATSSTKLAEAVINVLESTKNRQKAAKAVAGYLVAERQTKNLNSLLRHLEKIQLEQKGRLEVTATTATPLTEAAKKQISQLFDAREITVHEEIDKNILGGVRVRALDKVADFSLQARLRQLRRGRNK